MDALILNDKVLIDKAKPVKLVIFDVDGVLTDGMMNYGPDGELFKQFNVKDGVGIKLLQQQGIDVAVITAKRSAPLSQRMADLGIGYFYPGCDNKLAAYHELLDRLSLKPQQICYVGDDVIDLAVMAEVGLSVAVRDAHFFVKEQADYITETAGGEGVAREVADCILDAQFDLRTLYTQMIQNHSNKNSPENKEHKIVQ